MRVQRFRLDGFGFPVETASLRPVATPQPFRGFGGAWEDWCDTHYYTPGNNEKCRKCSFIDAGPCLYPAPHTMAGRLARGLPQQTDLERLGPPVAETPDEVVIPEAGDSWLEDNKLLIGVGAAGLLGLVLLARRSKRGGGFLGFGSTPRRRRKSRKN